MPYFQEPYRGRGGYNHVPNGDHSEPEGQTDPLSRGAYQGGRGGRGRRRGGQRRPRRFLGGG